jgi:glutathione S-transferase
MKLLYQTHSPYARKTLVFAHEVGVADQIEVVHYETSPTVRNEAVFAQNPLGKVPVLMRDGFPPLFDSDVICAYLDTIHAGPPLIPREGEARWHALKVQAIAQGIADAGIAYRWETVRRPAELRYAPLAEGHRMKLEESYQWLERELDFSAPVHVGHIAVATVLSWVEFRRIPGFRERAPALGAWLDEFSLRRSMVATPLSGETHDSSPPRTPPILRPPKPMDS